MDLIKPCSSCDSLNEAAAFYCTQCGAILSSAPIARSEEPSKPQAGRHDGDKQICTKSGCDHQNPIDAEFCELCLDPLDSDSKIPIPLTNATTREGTFGIRFPFGIFPLIEVFRIGREPEFSSIAKELEPFDGVSRRHTKFLVSGSVITITDRGSTNGIFVNGTKIIPHKPEVIKAGDEIAFGLRLRCTLVNNGG